MLEQAYILSLKLNYKYTYRLLFITCLLSIIATARMTLKMRAKMMGFGLLLISVFLIIQFLTIIILSFGTTTSSLYKVTSIAVTAIIGGLLVDVALFSTLTIPPRTKIKPKIKRSYRREFVFFAETLILSSIVVYFVSTFLYVDIDSPIIDFIYLNLFFRVQSILSMTWLVSNLIYEVRAPGWLRAIAKPSKYIVHDNINNNPLSLSFLITAYNEEKLIGKVIEAIDIAASNFQGKTEIVVVNDGSTDSTEKILDCSIKRLKYCSGRYFTIPNSGKGFGLAYGLKKISGEVVLRMDADCIIDENALTPMMQHFIDPQTGSVSGFIFPLLEGKSAWLRMQNVWYSKTIWRKRMEEVVDGIITQPGGFTAFRKEALLNVGGWQDNIFGEDGEITSRVARAGYRGEVEQRSIIYTDLPETLISYLQQQARWSVGFYHSRGRNLYHAKEWRIPRSFIFIWNLIQHGNMIARSATWSFLAAAVVTGTGMTLFDIPYHILAKFLAIHLIMTGTIIVMIAYRLKQFGKLHDLWYFPLTRLATWILNYSVKPQVMEILFSWSSKWREYDTQSFKALRKEVNRSVDPGYPSGEEQFSPSVILEGNQEKKL